jgi:hypothetical protein
MLAGDAREREKKEPLMKSEAEVRSRQHKQKEACRAQTDHSR